MSNFLCICMQYLNLKAISDQNSILLTELEVGAELNRLQLENLTQRIAINSATLVRSSVNISELRIQLLSYAQDLAASNSQVVSFLQSNALLQSDINALSKVQTLIETAMILPVNGQVISANETLIATQDCPSGYSPIKVGCSITGLNATSFVEETTLSPLTGPPSASLIRESIEGTSGTCTYQIFYIDSSSVQKNIVFSSVTSATEPVTVTAEITCRAT